MDIQVVINGAFTLKMAENQWVSLGLFSPPTPTFAMEKRNLFGLIILQLCQMSLHLFQIEAPPVGRWLFHSLEIPSSEDGIPLMNKAGHLVT